MERMPVTRSDYASNAIKVPFLALSLQVQMQFQLIFDEAEKNSAS